MTNNFGKMNPWRLIHLSRAVTHVVTAKQDRLEGGTALVTTTVGLLIYSEHDKSHEVCSVLIWTEYREL